jgi:hypothetical protein
MSEPLVLVILLGTNSDPTTDSMMSATRRALGPEAVVLADTSRSPTDADALAISERVRARAVARISWADGSARVARLRVHVDPSNDWTNDEVTFSSNDAPTEKGRTIGYMLASMVQRIEREHSENVARLASSAPATAAGTPGPTLANSAAPPGSPEKEAPPAAGTSSVDVGQGKIPSPRKRTMATGIELLAHGVGAIGDGATAIGGSVGLRWSPIAHLGLRAAAGGRAGTIGAAEATTTTLFVGGGPGYRTAVGRSLELGVRADLLVLEHRATRDRPVETTRKRWLGAADVVFEAIVPFGAHAGLSLGVGMEVAFGTTPLSVGGVTVASIPPLRGIAEIGARIHF